MFDQYARGRGDYNLTTSEFNSIIAASAPDPKNDQQISLYGSPEYDYALGKATVSPNNSAPTGLRDDYNFDPRPWGDRGDLAEIVTRAVNYLAPSTAKNFTIGYPPLKR